MRRTWAASVVLAGVLVAGGCGGSDGGPPGPVNTTPPESTNGIQWSKGRLWIAGAITQGYGPEDGLGPNDDLVLVEGGAFVVTEPSRGTVSRFDPKRGRTELAEIGPQANGIARCADGRVFANLEWPAGAVFEIDPSGATPPRQVTGEAPGLNSMACVGEFLYAPTFFKGGVIRVHRETGEITTIVETGLNLPSAVHAMPDGTIVALQVVLPVRLMKVDVESAELTELARIEGMIADNFAVGPDGTFYVTDFFDAGVVVISPDGTQRRIEL
ncbi:MAG: hypothetical protein IPK07_28250 [Deltaproteobacteria bacterium]|nr:hypothetical protein [Deltaproteobacteria bacterium]